jgi:hypothetical protein
MKNGDGAYIQAYSAQAVVDGACQIITAADISTNPADALNYTTMLDQSAANTGVHTRQALADAGYCSETNLAAAALRKAVHGTDTLMATGRLAHDEQVGPAPRGRIPADATLRERMAPKLRTKPGRAAYAQRNAHRRTRLRPDHDLPGRTRAPGARRERSLRRVATARRVPQPAKDLPALRNRRTGRRPSLTGRAACLTAVDGPHRRPPQLTYRPAATPSAAGGLRTEHYRSATHPLPTRAPRS